MERHVQTVITHYEEDPFPKPATSLKNCMPKIKLKTRQAVRPINEVNKINEDLFKEKALTSTSRVITPPLTPFRSRNLTPSKSPKKEKVHLDHLINKKDFTTTLKLNNFSFKKE